MNQATAAPHRASMYDAAGDDLVTALNSLDVPFLAGGGSGSPLFDITPASLLAQLAASPEARLRLALIPLLLRHPEFAAYVDTALEGMPAPVANGFKCYCAAQRFLTHMERRVRWTA